MNEKLKKKGLYESINNQILEHKNALEKLIRERRLKISILERALLEEHRDVVKNKREEKRERITRAIFLRKKGMDWNEISKLLKQKPSSLKYCVNEAIRRNCRFKYDQRMAPLSKKTLYKMLIWNFEDIARGAYLKLKPGEYLDEDGVKKLHSNEQ